MRRILFLLSSLFVFAGIHAQRSFQLMQDSNFWLTSGSAAALTTMNTSNFSNAELFNRYGTGRFRDSMQGKSNYIFGSDVRSYVRMTDRVVAYGKISYCYNSISDVSGSMLLPVAELMSFDLKELSEENAGKKRYDSFNISGAVGWNPCNGFSVGASADFTAGTYAKFKDLRHTNSLMNLDIRLNAFYSFGGFNGVGVSGIYRRRTETVSFETYGTTDKTYRTLIEYANGYGHIETFGGEGFTDDSREVPIVSRFMGFALQCGYNSLFAKATYLHRTGYYGNKSQYTVCHSNNRGDFFNVRLRYVLPRGKGYLCMFNIYLTSQLLSTYRTNYRRANATHNTSVTYYEYFDDTKMSDKARNEGGVEFIGYWRAANEIFLWKLRAGIGYIRGKETAYIFPESFTVKTEAATFYADVMRNFVLKNTVMLWLGVKCESRIRYLDYVESGISAGIEFPSRVKSLRPYISAEYDFKAGTKEPVKHKFRNNLIATVGVNF